MDELDKAVDRIIRESEADIRAELDEAWSDAARAASAAARRAKVKGGDWRKAAKRAYRKKFLADPWESRKSLNAAMDRFVRRKPSETALKRQGPRRRRPVDRAVDRLNILSRALKARGY